MSERPLTDPYRSPDVPEPSPPSPEIDPSILASAPVTPVLILASFWVPVWLLLTWLTDMEVKGCGPTHVETMPEKIGTTIVLTLVLALVIALRVRHGLRQRAALRALEGGSESTRADARLRVDAPRAELEEVEEGDAEAMRGPRPSKL